MIMSSARRVSNLKSRIMRKCWKAVRGIAISGINTYDSRRIRKALNVLNYLVGRCKGGSLMRETGVQVRQRKKYKVTTNSNHEQPVFENKLNRQFDVASPNQATVGDITRRLAVSGSCYRSILQKDSWLEYEFADEGGFGMQCITNGYLAAPATSRIDCTFR